MTTFVQHLGDESFLAHLDELRRRVFIACGAVGLGMLVGWFLYPFAYALVAGPVLACVREIGGTVMTMQPGEAFFTQMKFTAVLGIVLASPVILLQLWLFIRPGLLPAERRAVAPLVPAISLLFLAGMTIAYLFLPRVIVFFSGFVPQGVTMNMAFQESINFPLKIMLAFGLAFQLPIVLIGLVLLHVLTPAILLAQWRPAILIMAAIAALITPTVDPFSMMLLLVPLLILYFGTVMLAFHLVKRPE